jgi:hypothetical protein
VTRLIVSFFLALLVAPMAGCGSADKTPSIPLVTAPLIDPNKASEVELNGVPGLTDALFVKVGLNTGAEEDYKLIPSTMSPGKLAHEFEEYRPYESMDQFRREMAKYVSEEEVAYLVRYVTLD